MRAVTTVMLVVLGCVSAGCLRPVKLKVVASPAVPGELSARPTTSDGRAETVDHCPLPCELEIPYQGAYEVTLRAPGYFPATVEIPGPAATFYKQHNPEGALVVPLLPREAAADPH